MKSFKDKKKNILFSFTILFFLAGCATGNSYKVKLNYELPKIEKTTYKGVAGVQLFRDLRQKSNRVGVVEKSFGEKDSFVTGAKPINILITNAVKEILRKKGYKVVDYSDKWDYEPSGLPDKTSGLDIIIGGDIDDFWLEGKSTLLKTDYKVKIDIEYYKGMINENKVITNKVTLEPEKLKLLYKPEDVDKILVEGMNEAIKSMVADL